MGEHKEEKMEFQRERVYTALNADELKPGDKVIVADNLADLKKEVEKGNVHEIEDILSDCVNERFGVCGMANYALAYLVERAEPKTEHDCQSCKYKNCGFKDFNTKNECDRWEAEVKAEMPELISLGNGQYVEKPKTIECADCAKSKNGGRGTCVLTEEYGCDDYEPKTEPRAEKKYRPFANTDELIKVWEQNHRELYPRPAGTMPLIWVQAKNEYKTKLLITGYDQRSNTVRYAEGDECDMKDLFEYFEFLDDSPCGVEE
jgi:hypothetical protein